MEQQTRIKLLGSSFYNETFPLYVNRAEEGFDLRFHLHDFVEVTYVAEGKGFHHIGGDTIPARQGDLFLVPEGVPHVFRPESAGRSQRLVVYNAVIGKGLWHIIKPMFIDETGLWDRIFGGSTPADTGDEAGEGAGKWIVISKQGENMNTLFQEFHYEFRSAGQGRKPLLLAHTIRLLVMIQRGVVGTKVWKERDLGLSGALDHIRLHYREPLTLEGLADRFGLSARHLFRLFKQRTGQTFGEYLQSVRMEAACKLLRETESKILTIAEAVGYRDTDSFYRVFKQWTGSTPGEYRRRE